MKKPIKPLPTDCCGSGCDRCVYDIYVEHLKRYRKWKQEQKKKEEQTQTK
ncbi:oxidoreductase-like domain-containing protein [Aliifodinibius salicampi]|uniref:Oxidoreductase-like domain-containing protein n=1 Tax=Fodinibius salicampi TaxID=1920655 RepID=A0ABT3PV70_9BACT|nr:oxidoreductase-like domain-containing protein [Fodinibius salicampi]MCW9711755.1 oxidoreductase-like domain-containing protein [Fodinibius salicampi]